MPTLPNTPSGVVRSRMHFSPSSGFNIRPRFDMIYTGTAPTTAILASTATAVRVAFNAQLKAYLSSSYELIDVECYDLQNRSTPFGADTTPVVGTRTGGPTSNSTCALINFTPNRSYRGSKPKIFLPFFTTTDIGSVTGWSAGSASALTTAWEAFIAALTGQTIGTITLGAQCGVSYYGPPTVPNTGKGKNKTMSTLRATPLVETITAVAASQTYGSQRRRLRAG